MNIAPAMTQWKALAASECRGTCSGTRGSSLVCGSTCHREVTRTYNVCASMNPRLAMTAIQSRSHDACMGIDCRQGFRPDVKKSMSPFPDRE